MSAAAAEAAEAAKAAQSVLLVEDDVGNALTMSALLEDSGFRVDTVASLAESRRQLADASYALVLLDNKLGDGHSHELIPELRTHLPAARIILVCGERPARLPHPVDALHLKGDDFAQLLRTIQRLLPTT